jgi:Zn-dependent M28 family amino/carboxypeptidase
VRFAWWAAEEEGLLGSQHYVDTLTAEERAEVTTPPLHISQSHANQQIVCNLNFDMLGSPNFVRSIYNGSNAEDESKNPPPRPSPTPTTTILDL